jgi:hypothetical protein
MRRSATRGRREATAMQPQLQCPGPEWDAEGAAAEAVAAACAVDREDEAPEPLTGELLIAR